MKIEKLDNDNYQVVTKDNTVVLQGTYDKCLDYMTDRFLNKIQSTPELKDVFKRMKDK